MNRFVAAVAALIGLVLVGGTMALGLIPAAAAGERLLSDARPIVIGDVPGALPIQGDVDAFTVAANRTVDEVFPAIAADPGLSPAEFDGLPAREYPAVAVYAERTDELVALIAGIADNLQARQADFAAAGSYPVAGVSPSVMPVGVLVLGGLLVLAAAVLWRRSSRAAFVVVLLAGLVLAGGSLALGLPEKAQAAQRVYDSVAITAENTAASLPGPGAPRPAGQVAYAGLDETGRVGVAIVLGDNGSVVAYVCDGARIWGCSRARPMGGRSS